MGNFTKAQMLYENQYTWRRDEGDGKYIGKIDRDRLDRDEGYEVLYFANSSFPDNTPIGSLHRFESLIREKLPKHIVMKTEIIDFLKKNW